ncbi:hypothetical protein [Thalassotalea ganghwensis]
MRALLLLYLTLLSCSLVAKEFIVGVQDVSFYPLYDFPNPSYAKELLDTFAASKGYKFTYLPLPIKRIDYWYSENAIDFKYPDNKRWSGGQKFYPKLKYSLSTLELLAATVVPKNNLGKSRKSIKRLGTILGFHPTMWLDLIKKGNTVVVESPSALNIVKQLVHGHVDATNLEPSVVNHFLSLIGEEGALVVDLSLPHEVYSYHLSTINHPEILEEFNLFLTQNQALLLQLQKKYKITNLEKYQLNL